MGSRDSLVDESTSCVEWGSNAQYESKKGGMVMYICKPRPVWAVDRRNRGTY